MIIWENSSWYSYSSSFNKLTPHPDRKKYVNYIRAWCENCERETGGEEVTFGYDCWGQQQAAKQ